MHPASKFNVKAKLCIHCFVAFFCTIILRLLSLRASCFGASHCFKVVGAIVRSFFVFFAWCEHFSANDLGGIVLEWEFIRRDAFFCYCLCLLLPCFLWEIFHRDNDSCRDHRASAAREELLLKSSRLVSYGDNILRSVGSSSAAIC
uniref:Uncharacterized protein n=1 Tax=Rhipicephalus zambeziensis TaxID=60191 RepID=A0A224YC70_9ACAR